MARRKTRYLSPPRPLEPIQAELRRILRGTKASIRLLPIQLPHQAWY